MDEALVQAARADLAVFTGLVHASDQPEVDGGRAYAKEHHWRMVEALTDGSLGHTLIVAPRGSGKTTLVQSWLEWELGRASLAGGKRWQNDWRVVYFSNTAHQAYRVSNAIKATIETNPLYQAVFPAVKPHKDKWSQEEWKVQGNTIKDSNFQAFGVGGPALGARALMLVFDDVGDQENMHSPGEREKLLGSEDGDGRGWMDQTAMPILVPWGRAVMMATRWAWWDPPAWAQKRGWHSLVLRALYEDQDGELRSYWPERFPVEWLEEKRREAPKAFSRQYQNEVTPDEGLIFKREWFAQRYDYLPAAGTLFLLDSWDTAFGQGRNRSYSVGLSALVTSDYHIYIRHMIRGQLPYSVLRDSIKSLHEWAGSHYVVIENKQSGQAAIQDSWLQGVPIIEWNPAGQKGAVNDKLKRAQWVTEWCMKGMLHLPSDYFVRQHQGDWLGDFEQELLSYPDAENDDIVDALSQLIEFVEVHRQRMQPLRLRPPEPVRWRRDPRRKALV